MSFRILNVNKQVFNVLYIIKTRKCCYTFRTTRVTNSIVILITSSLLSEGKSKPNFSILYLPPLCYDYIKPL